MAGFSDIFSLILGWHGGTSYSGPEETPSESIPAALPSITLDGISFYIRADTYNPDMTTVAISDTISLTHKVRRLVGAKARGWEFVVALRSWTERLQFEGMYSEVGGEVVDFTINDEEYEVTIDSVSTLTTVGDNTDFWDVKLVLTEWIN